MDFSDEDGSSTTDEMSPLHLSDDSDASLECSHQSDCHVSGSETDVSTKGDDELHLHLSSDSEDRDPKAREADDKWKLIYGITESFVSLRRDKNLDGMAVRMGSSKRNDASYRTRRMAKIISRVDEENDTDSILLEPEKVIPFVNENWSGVTRRNAFNQICSYLQQSDLSYSKVLKCLPLYRAERRKVDNFRSSSKDSGRAANVQKKLSDASTAAAVSAAENLDILEKNLKFAVEKQSFWIKETGEAWAAATKALFVIIAAENTPKHAVALRCVDVEKMSKGNAGFEVETKNFKFSFKEATACLMSRYASLRKYEFTGASQHLLVNLKKKPLTASNYIPSSKPPKETTKPKCSICGKSFSSTSYLQVHLRVHMGDKKFRCQHCAASFADKSNLNQHLHIHDRVGSSEDVDSPE